MITWRGYRRSQAALVAAFLLVQAVPALAERDPLSGAPQPPAKKKKVHTPSPITDRLAVEGIFYPFSVHTGVRFNPGQTPPEGTFLSAERDLGLPSRIYQGRVELMLRLRERSRLLVDFEDLDRSGSEILNQQVVYGDQTFAKGQRLDSELAWRFFTVTYEYSLYRSDWLEVSTGLALHMIQAQAHANVDQGTQRADQSIASGFPTIPLDVTWRFTRQLSAVARGQFFRLGAGNFSGTLMDLHGDVQYRWTPNFSVGLGYTLERIAADSSTRLSIDTRGEEAFFRMSL